MIVHDLRNPATQIKFALELALDKLNKAQNAIDIQNRDKNKELGKLEEKLRAQINFELDSEVKRLREHN